MTGWTHIFGLKTEGIQDIGEAARRSNEHFVRGTGQLAPYKPDRCPTGHILTAWEAFDAFGIEVLEEAVEYGAAILKHSGSSAGQVLKARRERLNLSPAQVARAASVSEQDMEAAESSSSGVRMEMLSRIALLLGMDERLLAFGPYDPNDGLAVRLRTLQREAYGHPKPVSPGTALLFAEAASIIRIEHRLRRWLSITGEVGKFEPDGFYGSPGTPAWKAGYDLAEKARNVLELGGEIRSMRELVEKRLGIPVVQASLPENAEIAGATVATTDKDGNDARGIVLNIEGANRNVWVRRTTLAHELGHLLYDPVERIENLRIDSYEEGKTDPQGGKDNDAVEQRANAFAIAFLAPNEDVRKIVSPLPSADAVAKTMRRFGIGQVAARYHIHNCLYRKYEIPHVDKAAETPSDEQKAAEDFTIDYFPFPDTRYQRRGQFSYLVAKCHKEGFLSEHTAALYLQCTVEDLVDKLDSLIELYE